MPSRLDRGKRPWLPALGLIIFAFATRGWLFGNPAIHIDEQFYLLVGKRMAEGAIPYVDIWDRKPIGLFLIYAGAGLFGDGVLAYQILATLAAAATAILVYEMALPSSSRPAALVAAICYLLYLFAFNGAGGQSPVFYNLPMALAAWLLMRLIRAGTTDRLGRNGAAVMLLAGLAIQIKYSAVFEGVFFGLALLWLSRRLGRGNARLMADGTLWVAAAMAPTLAAIAVYVDIGHAAEFIQANFLSTFARHDPVLKTIVRFLTILLILLPLLLSVLLSRKAAAGRAIEARFARAWAGATIIGYLLFGSYYDHYALPLLPPLAVAAAPAFATPRIGRVMMALTLVTATGTAIGMVVKNLRIYGDASGMRAMTTMVAPHLHGCLYVFEGPPLLYQTTHACFLSRYVFPFHLSLSKEKEALGVDVQAEVGRILARHPSVIVLAQRAQADTNLETRAMVIAELHRHYRLVGGVTPGDRRWLVFERSS